MCFKTIIVFIFACSVYYEAAYVDNLHKCSIKDDECLKIAFSGEIKNINETGIPVIDIPSIDPLELKNESVSILGLFDINLTEGKVFGIKNLFIDEFSVDIDNKRGILKLTYALLTLEGHYQAAGSNPLFKSVLGSESIHGEGKVKIGIENITLNLDFTFYAQKRDGEIYLICDYDHIVYEYEILGKVKLFIDNLYVGQKESSDAIVKLFNDNWKMVMGIFGKTFVGKALKIGFNLLSKFYDHVPVKYYLTDDFSSYAKP